MTSTLRVNIWLHIHFSMLTKRHGVLLSPIWVFYHFWSSFSTTKTMMMVWLTLMWEYSFKAWKNHCDISEPIYQQMIGEVPGYSRYTQKQPVLLIFMYCIFVYFRICQSVSDWHGTLTWTHLLFKQDSHEVRRLVESNILLVISLT